MYIETVKIKNHKSFLDRQTFQFEPGFNLLVGVNNSGKTTVLEALAMDASIGIPHRSERTMPKRGDQPPPDSEFEVTLVTCLSELRERVGETTLYLPVMGGSGRDEGDSLKEKVYSFVNNDMPLKLHITLGKNIEVMRIESDGVIFGRVNRDSGDSQFVAVLRSITPTAPPEISLTKVSGVEQFIIPYYRNYRNRIYHFSAKRQPSANCAASATSILDRVAATLPYCINHLQTNDEYGHRLLCGWIKRVYPDVHWVHATPIGGNFELRCLTLPTEAQRDDLSIPLSFMGTGIGNVIAMLYVVQTSREPQVIAIDEPNAFLHPRALRELLAILESEGSQHQYILTTHSADVLTAVNARSISFLKFDSGTTTVKHVGVKDLHILRVELAELGIRMTDLHAKDRVLWVEGKTEELVMPEVLRWACQEIAAGIAVLQVERTGTFSKKSMAPEEVAQIYKRLTSSSALVPPMVFILLDGETRSSTERQKIKDSSRGELQFLDRRMLENYLIHPESVAATLQELGVTVTPDIVRTALCRALNLQDLSGDLTEIDGAAALEQVFSELSGSSHEFRKTRDVPTIVSYIIDNHPEHLAPLRIPERIIRSCSFKKWTVMFLL